MIGVCVAAKKEWKAVLEYFNKNESNCKKYPYGEYLEINFMGKDIIFYRSGARKVNSAGANQYMITRFNINKIIVIGTCAGIDNKYKILDIIIPQKAVQWDCTVREIEPLIKENYSVQFDISKYNIKSNNAIIGTADKGVVIWKDYLKIKENGISIADMEAASIAYVCKLNNVECVIIKGISDFPLNEKKFSKEESKEQQIILYEKNAPIIMNNIIENYLEKFI